MLTLLVGDWIYVFKNAFELPNHYWENNKKSEFVFLFFISLKVGASYSAEDIALQTIKYGASKVICTYRTRPLGFKWPETIEERPIFTHVEKDGKVIHFSDGTTAEVDVILFCTGK